MMLPRLFICLGLFGILGGCGDPDPRTTVLAQAGGLDLMVEQVADLLAPAEQRTDDRVAAMMLANLWVDYVLLARAVSEDSTLLQLELTSLAEPRARQGTLSPLRDSIVRASAIPEAELRRRYDREAPRSEIRTRQILITVPARADETVEDSIVGVLEAFRAQIMAGDEDFGTLARRHSRDARSAQQGGDMGFYGRGATVPEFEEAAFALRPGEVSQPLRTLFGWHLVQMEERRTPTLEQFRRQLEEEALSSYLDELEARTEPQITQQAVDQVRYLARNPAAGAGQEGGTLIAFDGGAVTVGDLRRHLGTFSPQARMEIATAPPERIVLGVLRPLIRQHLLDEEAGRQGLVPEAAEIEAEAARLRQRLRDAARQIGIAPVTAAGPEPAAALDPTIMEVLGQIARNERQVTGLGSLGHVLREHYGFKVRSDRANLVERRVLELRQQGGAPELTPESP
jgi:parvulin-like peptidyl-prolyl isomerase